MAVRQFALRLDETSLQTGEISFKELVEASAPVEFELVNVVAGSSAVLNLITRKNQTTHDHPFPLSGSNGRGAVTLSANELVDVFEDAVDGEWDFVEARWAVEKTDLPVTSVMHMIQNSQPYDYAGWPAVQS